jgi:hypothetical protein
MKSFSKLVAAAVVIFAGLQLIRPGIPAKPAVAEVQAPPEVRRILDKDCYSCHSDQRRLSWFDQVVPAYWLVRHDVLTAREHLDFSTLGSKPAAVQKATLYEAVNMIQLGVMPLPQFTQLHPEARVTPEELAVLKAYLAPWTPERSQPAIAPAGAPSGSGETVAAAPVSLAAVRPELNGLPFDPDFENWKMISTTDRGDNNTFRFVLGNDIAFSAAQSGNISPWPDGARFAKIAWQQESGSDGLIHPGRFVQVELMIKDAKRYKDTEGWGWGRWRGVDIKPYGNDEHFVNECTGCHQPLRGDDYVFTLPISEVNIARDEVVNNLAAALPATLPYQPLHWRAITMYVDPKTRTTAMLFGNDATVRVVQPRGAAPMGAAGNPTYPAGAVLALVTWAQRDDPHWFGARIPATPQSVEFVEMGADLPGSYRVFAGSGLNEHFPAAGTVAQRTRFMLDLAPAQLP